MPSTAIEYQPYGDYLTTNTRKARLGWLGLGSTRLDANTWGHVSVENIDAALRKWEAEP